MSHLFLAILLAASPDVGPLPSGPGERTLDVGGRPLTLHTYKSANARPDGPLVIVLHGTLRNAKEYRDWGEPIADRCGGLVVTPEFDSERFPSSAYRSAAATEFRWRLVEAEGIAHVAAEMFKNAKCDEARFGKEE